MSKKKAWFNGIWRSRGFYSSLDTTEKVNKYVLVAIPCFYVAASDKADPNVDRTAAVMAKLSALRDGMNAEEREMYEKAKKGGVGGGGGGGGSLEAEDRTGLSWKKVERIYPKNGPGGGNKPMNEKNKK